MKKTSIALTILSIVSLVAAILLLFFTPNAIASESSYFVVPNSGDSLSEQWNVNVFLPWQPAHSALFDGTLAGSQPALFGFFAAAILIAILFIVHFILALKKRRGNVVLVGILSLVVGLLAVDASYISLYPGYFPITTWGQPSGETSYSGMNVFEIMNARASSDGNASAYAYLTWAMFYLALALGLIALIVSIADVCKYPGASKAKPVAAAAAAAEQKPAVSEKAPAESDDEIRGILNSQLNNETAQSSTDPIVDGDVGPSGRQSEITASGYNGPAPTIVQYISYDGHGPEKPLTREEVKKMISEEVNGPEEDDADYDDSGVLTSGELRRIIREEIAKSEGKEEPLEEGDALSEDDLRSVIREELAKAHGEAPDEDAEADDGASDDGEPLTSDDLRAIVSEELDKHDKKASPSSDEGDDAEITYDDDNPDDMLTAEGLKAIVREELDKHDNPDEADKAREEADREIDYDAPLTTETLRSIIQEELYRRDAKNSGAEEEEEPAPDEGDEVTVEEGPELTAESLTADDLRSIISEELAKANDKRKEDEEEQAVEQATEEKPLTAQDLRALIQEALEEHDNPERRELTEDEARDLIVEQVKEYYDAKDKEEGDSGKGDSGLSEDELRSIIREELAPKSEEAEKVDTDSLKAAIAEELDKFTKSQKEAADKAAQEDFEARRVEQARAEAEAEQARAQSEEIRSLKESTLTRDDIRAIVAEEFDKKLAERTLVEVRNVPSPAPEPAPEPKPEPAKEEKEPEPVKEEAPAPVEEEKAPEPVIAEAAKPEEPAPEEPEPVAPAVAEAPAAEPKKIVRISFAERMLRSDKDLKSLYNELKAEALSYGLKSRLANDGDSFRLHTKRYLMIRVSGKHLKLYFALDPKDYADGPIPVHPTDDKKYADIPAVFNVKSPLSLKRAKQLIADACEKDALEQGKIVPSNYANALKDYKPQLGKQPDLSDLGEDEGE
jgi:hypothetical protein